jgi:hypothetical protein
MNPKTTLILVAVLVLAGVAYLLTTKSDPGSEDGPTGQDGRDKLLLEETLRKTSIDRLLIQSDEGGDGLEVTRDGNRWRVTQPHNFPADASAVKNLFALMRSVRGYESEGGAIPETAPRVYLNPAQEQYALTLGQRRGAQRAELFLSDADNTTRFNAQDTLHDFFESFDPANFYANKLQVPLMAEVDRIAFETPTGKSLLVQRNEQWWIGDSENAERALSHEIDVHPGVAQLFQLLQTIELIDLQDTGTSPAAFGLEEPIATFRLSKADDQAKLELRLGVPENTDSKTHFIGIQYTGHPKPVVFTISTQFALLLGQDATAFRDPRVMTIPRSLIGSLVIKNKRGHYTIRFMPNGIQFVTSGPDFTPDVTPQETNEGEIIAQLLSKTRAIDYVTRDITDVKPVASVVIHPRLDGEKETLTIYPDTNETVLIRRNDEQTLLKVERTSIQMLLDRNFTDSSD